MATMEDFKKRLAFIREEVTKQLPAVATVLTMSAKAMAERNIKEKGVGRPYSTNPIPVWWFEGKDLNAAGREWLRERKGEIPTKKRGKKNKERQNTRKDGLGTWGEFRAAQGLQHSFVDLSYSNKMFANMGPGEPRYEGKGLVIVPLVATNVEAQNKMNWNREREGDFITDALTDEDKKVLTEVVTNEIVAILDNLPAT